MPNRSPNPSRRRVAALCTALVVASVVSGPLGPSASAQTDPTGPSTTQAPSSSAPSTTTTPTTPATSVVGDPSTTTSTTTPPVTVPNDVVADVDAPPEAVPLTDLVVPPRPPSSGGSYGQQASRVIRQQLRVARAEAVQIQAAFEASLDRVQTLSAQRAELQAQVAALSAVQIAKIRELQEAEAVFENRVADAFIRGNVGELSAFFQAEDVNDFMFSNELTEAVAEADVAAVERVVRARQTIDDSAAALAGNLRTVDRELTQAQDDFNRLRYENDQAKFALRVFAAGGEIVISGFVFPVGTPNQFSPTFGAPRMPGSVYAHSHQGTDILADFGTPLYACERGVITKMGTDVLGGIKLWLLGESGTSYYYAHLQAFEPGITEGSVVDAGTVIGSVGDTGNARGGVPHLHFEIHPNGGPAVDPYPLLAVVAGLDRSA